MSREECQSKVHLFINDYGGITKFVVNDFTVPHTNKITIESGLDEYSTATIQIPILFMTVHHVGNDGVERRTIFSAGVAPNVEKPEDVEKFEDGS